MTFNPATDFFTVADTRHEIKGKEVTTLEPVVVAYYLTRWQRVINGITEINFDLSIQWVGQLLGKVVV